MAVSRREEIKAGVSPKRWMYSWTCLITSSGQFGDQGAIGNQKDGNLLVAVAHAADNVERGALFELRVAFEIPVEQDGGVAGVGSDERKTVFRRSGADDRIALLADGVDEALHGPVGDGVGAPDLTRN